MVSSTKYRVGTVHALAYRHSAKLAELKGRVNPIKRIGRIYVLAPADSGVKTICRVV
jgi:hypothetical protein